MMAAVSSSGSASLEEDIERIGGVQEERGNQNELVKEKVINENGTSEKDENEKVENVKAKKNGRKGSKKSRGGCFTCKRQKLKCKENRPTCDYCAHRDIKCEWPILYLNTSSLPTPGRPARVSRQPVQRPSAKVPKVGSDSDRRFAPVLERLPRTLQTRDRPPVFGMEDMRLFNHFIQNAYPNHPRGNDSIWTHEVPHLSSEYDYLIHSMLALAASELCLIDRRRFPSNAMKMHHTSIYHRSLAVSSLRLATQRGILTSAEGNAMLATILTLMFQSTFIADGLIEYMSFLRGTIVVSKQMSRQGLSILFKNATKESRGCPEEDEVGHVQNAPILQKEVVQGSVKSLRLVAGLCRTRLERKVWKTLMNAALSLEVCSVDAYVQLRKMYLLFCQHMTPTEFNDFTSSSSPSAQTFKILQAHFVAMQIIMEPVAASYVVRSTRCPVKDIGRTATIGWLTALHGEISDRANRYCAWTRFVEREILNGRLLDGSFAEGTCVFEDEDLPSEISSRSSSISEKSECPWSVAKIDAHM